MTNKADKRIIKTRPILILGLIILALVAGLYIFKDKIIGTITQQVVREETESLEQEISRLEQELARVAQEKSLSPTEEETPNSGQTVVPPTTSPKIKSDPCAETSAEIQDFFDYLDKQDYIIAQKLPQGSMVHFKQLVEKLLANPPIVARETDSLFTILTNTAHFYRVLGAADVALIKDLITREGQLIEPTLAIFYKWSTLEEQCDPKRQIFPLPLQGLYEYAGFFLNTLGGQAYLFRRESQLRMLIKYYCILVLDRANAKIVNRHGIDIRLPIKSMIEEMEATEALTDKDHYLQTLAALQNKYQAQYETPKELTVEPEEEIRQ